MYIECGMGGKVDMKEAYDMLGKEEGWSLSIRKAKRVISERKGFHLFEEMRVNRLGRKK